jgi:hypothetical protein
MATAAIRRQRAATPERWQRALKRALLAGVTVRQLNTSGEWIVTSASDPTVAYTTDGRSCSFSPRRCLAVIRFACTAPPTGTRSASSPSTINRSSQRRRLPPSACVALTATVTAIAGSTVERAISTIGFPNHAARAAKLVPFWSPRPSARQRSKAACGLSLQAASC